MKSLARARLGLILAALSALAIVGFELPFGELLHQRAELQVLDVQLAALDARNASLHADITALSQSSTIAAIAHEEYGLIRPGQRSFVILPAAGAGTSVALSAPSIPPQDLVAAPPGSSGVIAATAAEHASPGFWERFADRLAFWRWAF